MVAVESVAGYAAPAWQPHRRTSTLVASGCIVAVSVALFAFLLRGGGMNGAHYAAELVQRIAALVFVVAFVAGPLARLYPTPLTTTLGREQRGLMLAFAAVYGVFMASLVAPYLLSGTPLPVATAALCAFSGFILAVLLACTYDVSGRFLGPQACRGLQTLAGGYFWLAFALGDLDRLAGPHRPDSYYGLALFLLIAALLVRFADSFVQRRKFQQAEKVN